jgi:hypothetical protein
MTAPQGLACYPFTPEVRNNHEATKMSTKGTKKTKLPFILRAFVSPMKRLSLSTPVVR